MGLRTAVLSLVLLRVCVGGGGSQKGSGEDEKQVSLPWGQGLTEWHNYKLSLDDHSAHGKQCHRP